MRLPADLNMQLYYSLTDFSICLLIAKWLSIFGFVAKSIRLKDNYPFLGNDVITEGNDGRRR
jgi:hypothetical protein